MTNYEDVFQAFTAKITDRDRAVMDDEVNEQDMIDLLNAAIPKFRLPHVSLAKDDDTETFDADLGQDEIQILANLMTREWYQRFIYDTDVIEQKYAENDFEFHSQANHLKAQINGMTELLDKEIKKMISDYSRTPNHRVFDYTKLAGK